MDELEKKGWEGFLRLSAEIQSPEMLKEIFDLFFTIEEKQTLAARYLIVKALLEGELSQREIAAEYKVSIAQITRGSNALKIISPSIRNKLQELTKCFKTL